ncbi:putative ester cyclase [Devosia sp. UYZn731]|uniref:ester cyclase n=1 Tax=Devosia sp. UYZn731 TaxID=3156345 RepID=UPI00339212F6
MATDPKRPSDPSETAVAPAPAKGNKRAGKSSPDRLANWGNQPMEGWIPPADLARAQIRDLIPNPLNRKNPTDYSISLRGRMSTDQQLLYPGERRQSMRGFEDHYTDIVDFTIRGTHRAWEEKDIGYVYDFYRNNILIQDEFGTRSGRDAVIAGSLGLMNAFPDMRWIPSEVIWAGDDEKGFHTSHRSFFVGTNTGWSEFGPPTGRRCTWWVVANCVCIGNEYYQEWVIENSASLVQQLGLDVRAVAREKANALDTDSFAQIGVGEPDRLRGQGKPVHMPPAPEGPFDPEDFVRRMLHYVWNWRLIGSSREFVAPNVRSFGPSGRQHYGIGDYMQNIVARLAMFPDLAHSVDDVYWMGNDTQGYQVAVRWSLIGTHTGHGIYGTPSGRRVRMWGISHFAIEGGKIVEEWTMFNEFFVLQQILRDTALSA